MRVALAQINPIVGAFSTNIQKMIQMTREAKRQGAELIVFPEMAICGYPPEDLLLLPSFVAQVTDSLKKMIEAASNITHGCGMCAPKSAWRGKGAL